VDFQSEAEIKEEILALGKQTDKKIDFMDAIEEHLKWKMKDEIRNDGRLKVFIKFCLEHKKVINSFIRVNQVVLNESFKNVVF